jgi:hypothetical protein
VSVSELRYFALTLLEPGLLAANIRLALSLVGTCNAGHSHETATVRRVRIIKVGFAGASEHLPCFHASPLPDIVAVLGHAGAGLVQEPGTFGGAGEHSVEIGPGVVPA